MTKVDYVVVAGIVAFVSFVCFTMGLLVRRSEDQELIRQLEDELDARQEAMPPEIAHEPVIVPRLGTFIRPDVPARETMAGFNTQIAATGPMWLYRSAGRVAADTTWDLPALTRTPPQGFIALPDWHAEPLDLDRHVAELGAELQEYVAALIAASREA